MKICPFCFSKLIRHDSVWQCLKCSKDFEGGLRVRGPKNKENKRKDGISAGKPRIMSK